MHITALIVVFYISCCIRVGAAPWRYFQANARYFSREKGIFSKMSIDQLIPEKWRLSQSMDSDSIIPSEYPVFLKPEWGQNGSGIVRADNFEQLQALRKEHNSDNRRFMIQEAATGAREFEIFGIRSGLQGERHDLVTVTESINGSHRYPINSIKNKLTVYRDVTSEFTEDQLGVLSGFIQEIGTFRITRVSARADSIEQLLAGDFKIIEINLFIPMPINIMDPDYTWADRLRFLGKSMKLLAITTKLQPSPPRPPAIFTRMCLYGRIRAAQERIVRRPVGERRTHP